MANTSDDSRFENWRTNKLQQIIYCRAIVLMASGHDYPSIAKYLGTSVRTLQRWASQEEFKINLKQAINLTLSMALANAADYSNTAINILKNMAEDIECPYKYRLQAIRLILQFTNREIPQDTIYREKQPHEEVMQKLRDFAEVKDLIAATRQQLPQLEPMRLEENQKIWEQLYPLEPYPDEDSMKKWFNDEFGSNPDSD